MKKNYIQYFLKNRKFCIEKSVQVCNYYLTEIMLRIQKASQNYHEIFQGKY